jgi:L-fuconolactonase
MDAIDTHQHYWDYDPAEYPWIQPDWPIRRSFGPKDLKPLLERNGFERCIAVQARQTLEESRWLLELADQHPFIAGVVGWVDLRSEKVAEQLRAFAGNPKWVGVRHVVQDEPDDRFMLRPEFVRGISALRDFDLTYDLLIFPKQLPAAIELVRRFPKQRFVLDHIAKPLIRDGILQPWAELIGELASFPNVDCKISGMVTEARWQGWKPEHFRPYLDVVWEAFGEDRLMIGSDWPVCLNSGSYEATMSVTTSYLRQFPVVVQRKILWVNPCRAYRIK